MNKTESAVMLGLLERYEPMAHMMLYINWRFTYLHTYLHILVPWRQQLSIFYI